jgi:hypothetical protein
MPKNKQTAPASLTNTTKPNEITMTKAKKTTAIKSSKSKIKAKPVKQKRPQTRKPVKKEVPASELKHHPLRYQIFSYPSRRVRRLGAQGNNLFLENTPIEVLSDGTIIFGNDEFLFHTFRDRPEHGAISDVPVIVRHDLEAAGERAILKRMVEDKTWRGKHTELEQFKCQLIHWGMEKTLRNALEGEPVGEEAIKSLLPVYTGVEVLLKACRARHPFSFLLGQDCISVAVAAAAVDLPEHVLKEIEHALDMSMVEAGEWPFYERDKPYVDSVVLGAVLKHQRTEAQYAARANLKKAWVPVIREFGAIAS